MQLVVQFIGVVVDIWLTVVTISFALSLVGIVVQMIARRPLRPFQFVATISQFAYALPFVLVALIWVWLRDGLRWCRRKIAKN